MTRTRASIADEIRRTTPGLQPVDRSVDVSSPDERAGIPMLVENRNESSLREWAARNRGVIRDWLHTYGGVLFRGFPMASAERFGLAIDEIVGPRLQYMNRSSPRTDAGDRIYTSTDYPSHLPIFPHNEHGYSPVFPLYVAFCCLIPAESGGATPIASTRRIRAAIPESVRERFRRKGILYVRNYHEGFGVSWQKAFQTPDHHHVEEYCGKLGIRCEWRPDGVLRTYRRGPAEVGHPHTGEPVWFNHGTFYHVTTLPEPVRNEMITSFAEQDLPNQTYYGDGSPMEPEVLDQLRAAYLQSLYRFEWKRNDVLLLDNMLAVHARDPYMGARRVLVSMAEEIQVSSCAASSL
jgi:alpha-ketoglutarate-dependent taurine dioxygenase